MGTSCSRQRSHEDDALLAAIRDGDDLTVRSHLQTSRLCAQPSKFYQWAAQVSALHGASNEGHLGVIRALTEVTRPSREASLREKQLFRAFLDRCNSYGQTPLMLACKNGHVDIVKHLLRSGADPLVQDKVHSRTCLHYAAWNGWSDCIVVLLSEECKVRLHNGLIGGANEAVVRDACGTARMVDMRSESGFTPLHFAVSASNSAAVKILLDKGASLTAEVVHGACYSIWPTGSTPLHIAAAKGSASVVRHILQAQANGPQLATDLRLSRDANGKRPVDVAVQLLHAWLEEILDPATPLQQAILPRSHRASRHRGPPSLTVLAGKAVQATLLGQLDLLAWQLRLRDGPAGPIPRSLKRQMVKASKAAAKHPRVKQAMGSRPTQPTTALPGATTEPTESQVSSDSEDKDVPGSAGPLHPQVSGESSSKAMSPSSPGAGSLSGDGKNEDEGEPIRSIPFPEVIAVDGSFSIPAAKAPLKTCCSAHECGVCLDRQTQLRIGGCEHECCYECAMTLVKKTKLAKTSIRCPFCRGVIGSFLIIDKAPQLGVRGGESGTSSPQG